MARIRSRLSEHVFSEKPQPSKIPTTECSDTQNESSLLRAGHEIRSIENWLEEALEHPSLNFDNGGMLLIPSEYRWDPYNEAAKRMLFCLLQQDLIEDYIDDPHNVPRIVNRHTLPSGELTGIVRGLCYGRSSNRHMSDAQRILHGVVRLFDHDFGYCVLQIDDSRCIAILLQACERVPEVGARWTFLNVSSEHWRDLVGPCLKSHQYAVREF